jgi:hypothetical protein
MYVLADRVLDGQLEARLRQWRAAGVSLRSIQALLEHDLGIKPALETIRRWLRDLENDPDNGDTEAA